ncbi:MAG: UpxY family transcription antiterminator [Bacteroidales bacterium]|nr:UpxY family transcription antiterminator [Bacteroidales bacterium]MBN2761944.1 UpxY family transcription antiterminator [Bacteroidales bacterium]
MRPQVSCNFSPVSRIRMQTSWFAIYTRPHHEKKVNIALQSAGIDSYLPMQTTLRQWSDRKKKVSVPFFSCYVFVHITNRHYYPVLNTPGVVRYVTFEGKAVAIPEKQIQLVKTILGQNIEAEEFDGHIEKGARVEIVRGSLLGLQGELINYASSKRVVIKIEEINKALLINIPLQYLRPVGCNS